MKTLYKQFLYGITFLMVGGFFVVGNITLAGPLCARVYSSDAAHSYTCENPNTPPKACSGAGQSCVGAEDCGAGTECCVCNSSSATPSTASATNTATPCTDTNADKEPVTGICSCKPGFTKVNDKCVPCSDPGVCCGVKLNTSIPFIGNCIESSGAYLGGDETAVSGEQAFPTLIGSLTKILVSVILITSFILIVVAGVMIASGQVSEGKKMIINVAIGLALLGASGVILHLINPNFFG